MNLKTAIERKLLTEKYLGEIGIPFIEHLPTIEEESETELRTSQEIAERIIILSYLCYIGEVEEDKPEVIKYLKKEKLWDAVSPMEKNLFLTTTKFEQQELINISWKAECIWILLWSIKKFEDLELPTDEIQIGDFIELLPDFMENPNHFIETSQLRDKSEILDQSDLLYRLHWAAKNDKSHELPINRSMIQERHYAINWITCYENLNWDEITTDT
jgi:Domain of unknown function (DUF4272)